MVIDLHTMGLKQYIEDLCLRDQYLVWVHMQNKKAIDDFNSKTKIMVTTEKPLELEYPYLSN